ncbi:DUF5004 domain-containing protein [Pedobacter nyackensis]|uniref:Lipocalin-like domain-containing protein n=1 Tax=Pedobacter nyackensis TaxID=475255 RepID=A0A1W2B5S2_9SPHI|nr:DUF5004 domain-containing protein [Pedobacter nyackensis]SMC68111.1 protein of unknown function [Pedobacter nyackensis]
MKHIQHTLFAICILLIWSCKPEDFGPIGEPQNIVKSIQGNWGLTKVTQIDQDASTKGFPYKQLDITAVYPYTDLAVAFLGDAQGNPTTFTITSGNSPKITDLTSGNWTVDNVKAPTAISLKNGTVVNILSIGSYISLKSGKLIIKKDKKLNGKVILSYQYEFTKK